MHARQKLHAIKLLHTAIWICFNIVIGYMAYAVIVNRLDRWLWIGYGLIAAEGLTLVLFRMYCPLTVWARRYSDSDKANFDIYLPEWLAKYNKEIYTSLMVAIGIGTLIRVLA